MQNALSPSLKALVADRLLRHTNVDVKVAVASCISEITRITAPDAPYDDDQMKVWGILIFMLWVLWKWLFLIPSSSSSCLKFFFYLLVYAGGLSANCIFIWKSFWQVQPIIRKEDLNSWNCSEDQVMRGDVRSWVWWTDPGDVRAFPCYD